MKNEPILLEREVQLGLLSDDLVRASAGRGGTTLVRGEAGIGKTSLVRRFASEAQSRADFLWGACDALFTPRPFGPLLDVTHEWGAPIRAALDEGADRGRLFAAVLDELARAERPMVILVEDLHWVDEATLDLLRYLGRRILDLPVLLVLTFRDDELGPAHPLRAVLGEWPRTNLSRVTLEPLSAEAVGVMSKGSGHSTEDLVRITGGNAFFVTELLSVPEGRVPESVSDAALARLGRLSPEARAVAELASTAPRCIEDRILEQPLGPIGDALDECLAFGILREERGAFAFRHELARLAVLESLPPGRRRRLHLSVMEALLGSSGERDLSRIVHHAAGAADREAVLEYAPTAARRAAAIGSHREARAYWRTALDHVPEPTRRRAELLESYAYEAYLTSSIEEAFESRRAAIEILRDEADSIGVGRNLRWMSRLAWFLGRRQEAEYLAEGALSELGGQDSDPAEFAMACSNRAQLAMLAQDAAEAVHWGTRAVALAEDLGDTEVLVHALNNVGTARFDSGDEVGRRELERSLELSLRADLQEHAARAYTNLASIAVKLGERRAGQYLAEGIAYCRERDLDSWSDYMRGWRARWNFERGRWDEAVDDAEAVLVRVSAPAVIRMPSLIVLARVRVRRGDPGAEAVLVEAKRLGEESGELQRMGPVAAAWAELRWLQGEGPERIAAAAQSAFELAAQGSDTWTLGELALWMHRGGALQRMPDRVSQPWASWIQGAWSAAAEAWAELERPYERAEALSGGDEEALQEALAVFHALGAAPAAERVRGLLRARGVRGIARGPRPSTRANPAGLTRRHMDVLRLLAEGLTYTEIAGRLFISGKTVEHHVGAILARLGVASSQEAVRVARDRGLLPQSGGPSVPE